MKLDFPKELSQVEDWVDRHFLNLSENDRLHMIHLAKVRILEDMMDEASGLNQMRRDIQNKYNQPKQPSIKLKYV